MLFAKVSVGMLDVLDTQPFASSSRAPSLIAMINIVVYKGPLGALRLTHNAGLHTIEATCFSIRNLDTQLLSIARVLSTLPTPTSTTTATMHTLREVRVRIRTRLVSQPHVSVATLRTLANSIPRRSQPLNTSISGACVRLVLLWYIRIPINAPSGATGSTLYNALCARVQEVQESCRPGLEIVCTQRKLAEDEAALQHEGEVGFRVWTGLEADSDV